MPKNDFTTINSGVLSFNKPGNFELDFTGSSVSINRGGGTTLTDAQFDALTGVDFGRVNKLSLSGIAFGEADETVNYKFEPDDNYDVLIKSIVDQRGVQGAVDTLTVNGGKADVFKLLWDYVDDHYSYYDTGINAFGVELGLAYANYLKNGGVALTDVVAKYAPDGGDAGTAPDRLQSMHDNLLGNLDINSIVDKFFDGNSANGSANVPPGYFTGGSNGGANGVANEALGQSLIDAVVSAGLVGRPYYGGYEGTDATPTVTWDMSHGLL
jgi:hypothetical protein